METNAADGIVKGSMFKQYKLQKTLSRVQRLIDRREFEVADGELSKLDGEFPDEPAVLIAQAFLEIERSVSAESIAAAIPRAERATKLDPENPVAWMLLAELRMKAGQLTDALSAFETADRLEIENGRLSFNLGVCLTRLGRTSEAYLHFERAVRLEPHLAQVRILTAAEKLLTPSP